MLICGLCRPAFGQIVQFIPEIYGRNITGLFNCKLTNPGAKQTVNLVITVTERSAGTVCQVVVPEFNLLPGTNPIPVAAARGASIQFSNNKLGQLSGLNHAFPEGDYDYCFEMSFIHTDNPPFEQCFSYTLAPFADLNLIEPYDKDVICDKRPLLTWQPLIPNIEGSRYQLVLTDIKEGQNATEALNYNLPVINQANLVTPVLPYPPVAKELRNKTRYAWQVTAYKDQTILNRSEVWEFKIDCADSTASAPGDNGYRNIEDITKGDYYITTGALKFVIINSYAPQQLDYQITSVAEPGKKLRGLPKIKLIKGNNQVNIDLEGNSSFTEGQFYLLKCRLPNGTVKYLRFLYHESR
ncbi:MAG: hypothetical protein JWQ57_564 [Mucilaginibacter sp.]|nr:hypothetical protein [Mucilaginibacter sp.]